VVARDKLRVSKNADKLKVVDANATIQRHAAASAACICTAHPKHPFMDSISSTRATKATAARSSPRLSPRHAGGQGQIEGVAVGPTTAFPGIDGCDCNPCCQGVGGAQGGVLRRRVRFGTQRLHRRNTQVESLVPVPYHFAARARTNVGTKGTCNLILVLTLT
jgi:hypothetical protein